MNEKLMSESESEISAVKEMEAIRAAMKRRNVREAAVDQLLAWIREDQKKERQLKLKKERAQLPTFFQKLMHYIKNLY